MWFVWRFRHWHWPWHHPKPIIIRTGVCIVVAPDDFSVVVTPSVAPGNVDKGTPDTWTCVITNLVPAPGTPQVAETDVEVTDAAGADVKAPAVSYTLNQATGDLENVVATVGLTNESLVAGSITLNGAAVDPVTASDTGFTVAIGTVPNAGSATLVFQTTLFA